MVIMGAAFEDEKPTIHQFTQWLKELWFLVPACGRSISPRPIAKNHCRNAKLQGASIFYRLSSADILSAESETADSRFIRKIFTHITCCS